MAFWKNSCFVFLNTLAKLTCGMLPEGNQIKHLSDVTSGSQFLIPFAAEDSLGTQANDALHVATSSRNTQNTPWTADSSIKEHVNMGDIMHQDEAFRINKIFSPLPLFPIAYNPPGYNQHMVGFTSSPYLNLDYVTHPSILSHPAANKHDFDNRVEKSFDYFQQIPKYNFQDIQYRFADQPQNSDVNNHQKNLKDAEGSSQQFIHYLTSDEFSAIYPNLEQLQVYQSHHIPSNPNELIRNQLSPVNSEELRGIKNKAISQYSETRKGKEMLEKMINLGEKIYDEEKFETSTSKLEMFITFMEKISIELLPSIDMLVGPRFFNDKEKILVEFLNDKNILLKQNMFDDLEKSFEPNPDASFKKSLSSLIGIIRKQTDKNKRDSFYMENEQQVQDFFYGNQKFFKLGKQIWVKSEEYSDEVYDPMKIIYNTYQKIPSEEIFTADKEIKKYTVMEQLLKLKKTFPKFKNSSNILRSWISVRNLFLLHSTVINKIFCEFPSETSDYFTLRQKNAIEFFDSMWSSKIFKFYDHELSYIEFDNLPLKKDVLEYFKTSCRTATGRKGRDPNHFEFRLGCQLYGKFQTMWKFITLWLAKERYDLYLALYHNEYIKANYKNLISHILYSLSEHYEEKKNIFLQ
ncbi:hypothetical protein PPACK8108_LOCUS5385 [Phakopsora pachyrhizi]|uniref:Uncharacterized protein n=1 Tax=Phakopsora pachyrhizi TaxID=170000 RepID=A0AAV0ARM4_PHAPC|nr:hypothetical protein PPACK8108_LOCUS5385 [Phakopsora pachyrhizi]